MPVAALYVSACDSLSSDVLSHLQKLDENPATAPMPTSVPLSASAPQFSRASERPPTHTSGAASPSSPPPYTPPRQFQAPAKAKIAYAARSEPDHATDTRSPTRLRLPRTGVLSEAYISTKKKYKPVARKIRPVLGSVPEQFRVEREIRGDPLAAMPQLSPCPPDFVPTGRYTAERRDALDKAHGDGFLWPEEQKLLHHFMSEQNEAFAWTDEERGCFKPEFFPPVEFPVVPHTPWVQKNIPIPPGLYNEVCGMIKKKLAAGVYEPSNSSYRSRWFCVLKKDKHSLRIVHSLEPLNQVTIQHSGVPPTPDHLAEQFGGRPCSSIFDLYVGYDERLIAETSRDFTTFQTPFGALRHRTLPMGWCNSVPIFHDDVTYILRLEIPERTVPYIDDVPIKGPESDYRRPDGTYETIAANPGIRRFVWEHFQDVNRITQRMKYAGGTFSGTKSQICRREILVVGHRCTPEGRLPDESRAAVIKAWGPCRDLSEVRAFLGTIGVARIFIRNFAHRAHALVQLTRKDVPFEFGEAQVAAQEDLKAALLASPALRAINYESSAPVILAVDTSYIAAGYHLCQCDEDDPRKRYYARFGSITLNEREARFSQPKLEIYGLYRALRALKLYLIGVRNIVVEVDARYIKGMLQNPDIAPSASINRWIVSILTFHFRLVHVPGTLHGPDGLSRRPRHAEDAEAEDDLHTFDDWIDNLHGFIHHILPIPARSQFATPTRATLTAAQPTEDGEDLSGGEVPQPEPDEDLPPIPKSKHTERGDARLREVEDWLNTLARPETMTDQEYTRFIKYAQQFFLHDNRLWRKDAQGAHKRVIAYEARAAILQAAHDELGHRGRFATLQHIAVRFWWPTLRDDVTWFVRTCHLCQIRQTRQIVIPPTVAMPAPVFARVHIDTMFLPVSGGFHLIVQARCALTTYVEWRMLRRETEKTLADFIYQDLLCRWGSLVEIVTDNGAAFVKAMDRLAKQYGVRHVRISGYNSRANGVVEHPHLDVRNGLFKVCGGDQSKWSQHAHAVFWSERITIRKRMGCSPYYAVTGCHPILPFDISEATYLLPAPTGLISTTELVARRAIALERRQEDLDRLRSDVFEARVRAARKFERDHEHTMRDFDFPAGALVLMRHTQIEKALNRKMRARYTGPIVVVSRNRGGAYVVCELDGTVFHRPVAAFRLIPYFPRQHIPLPPNFADISDKRLHELIDSTDAGDDAPELVAALVAI